MTYKYAGTGSTAYPASATHPTNPGTYQAIATVADATYGNVSSEDFPFSIDQTSAVVSEKANAIRVNVSGKTVSVTGTDSYIVYNIQGSKVGTIASHASDKFLILPVGVYIVKTGVIVQKIIVR